MLKCKICGKLYQPCGFPFCNKCMQEMDDKYKIVRDYLYDNPNATIEEVAQETEVVERMIVHFLREGRISMVNASGLLRCETCGAPIKTGRFCAECTRKLESKLTKATKPETPQAQKSYMTQTERKADKMYIERSRGKSYRVQSDRKPEGMHTDRLRGK